MRNIVQFIIDFYGQLFGNLFLGVKGLFVSWIQCFNIPAYWNVAKTYIKIFGGSTLAAIIIATILLLATFALIGIAILFIVRRTANLRQAAKSKTALIEEVNSLNREVMKLNLEKDKILSMKVSQIGLNPNEIATLTGEEMQTLQDGTQQTGENRFFHLVQIDEAMEEYTAPAYNIGISLPQICDQFRNFCCSRLHLYYEPKIIRLFLASFASTRIIILQGISGTGKTSLPYAFGKFIKNDAVIASVQPSWRDRTELFGYFNEFTKKYNETELLMKMYEALYNDDIYVTILDEMNIARVEYYFAEMLSILEMPTRDEWVVDLVPSVWANDPKKLDGGRLHIPPNMWYIGTVNNDDSTFAITDKVYDRAMPIDINTKGVPFNAPDAGELSLSSSYFETLLDDAKIRYKVKEETLQKVEQLDDYVIEHFRLAFGNRIVKQLRDFVPAYVGCGGTELEGLDYVLCKKVFRKFEGLNLSMIRDEIDGLKDYLDQLFGQDTMSECKEYLTNLKKTI